MAQKFNLNVFSYDIDELEDLLSLEKPYSKDHLHQSCDALREKLFSEIHGLPFKQSNWAHVPLGRILAPIGEDKMIKIKKLIDELNKKMKHEILIDKIHLVNEKRWYMEEKEYLLTKTLK